MEILTGTDRGIFEKWSIRRRTGVFSLGGSEVPEVIINKIDAYWTDDMIQRRDELENKMYSTSYSYTLDDAKAGKSLLMWIEEPRQEEKEINKLFEQAKRNYRAARTDSEIVKDVRDILAGLEKKDYLEFVRESEVEYNRVNSTGGRMDIIKAGMLAGLEQGKQEGYESCVRFISNFIVCEQLFFLKDNKRCFNNASKEIEDKVLTWYPRRDDSLEKHLFLSALDDIGFLNRKKPVKINGVNASVSLEFRGCILELMEGCRYSIDLDKVLTQCLISFTRLNNKEKLTRPATFTLGEYANKTSRICSTERAKRDFLGDLKENLSTLRKCPVYLKVKRGKKLSEVWEKGVISDFGFVRAERWEDIQVQVFFSDGVAEELVKSNLISWYPAALFLIDARNQNTYKLGKALARHYQIDNNMMKGTNNVIKIGELLKYVELPAYEDVKKRRGSWEERIKEPFERSLDSLIGYGVLKDWKYVNAKKAEMKDEKADIVPRGYGYFAEEIYLQFEMTDTLNHRPRLKVKQEKQRKEAEKKEKRKERAIQKAEEKVVNGTFVETVTNNDEFMERLAEKTAEKLRQEEL